MVMKNLDGFGSVNGLRMSLWVLLEMSEEMSLEVVVLVVKWKCIAFNNWRMQFIWLFPIEKKVIFFEISCEIEFNLKSSSCLECFNDDPVEENQLPKHYRKKLKLHPI